MVIQSRVINTIRHTLARSTDLCDLAAVNKPLLGGLEGCGSCRHTADLRHAGIWNKDESQKRKLGKIWEKQKNWARQEERKWFWLQKSFVIKYISTLKLFGTNMALKLPTYSCIVTCCDADIILSYLFLVLLALTGGSRLKPFWPFTSQLPRWAVDRPEKNKVSYFFPKLHQQMSRMP